ncbi:MAG TPA: DUF4339 domain-containing protein [Puia sp.]
MSTYLLLRNNKESGPYTIDELKRMSLKPFDLVWIEGKSAAWRYPGEIPEFSSFAPAAPEQPFDRFYKKPVPESAASTGRDDGYRKPPVVNQKRENRESGNAHRESVYINLPSSEKKIPALIPVVQAWNPIDLSWEEPVRSVPVKTVGRQGKKKQKWLVIGAVILFFGAGMSTGFFISNRRIFYSEDGNPPQHPTSPAKVLTSTQTGSEQPEIFSGAGGSKGPGSKDSSIPPERNHQSGSKKRQVISGLGEKDSLYTASAPAPAPFIPDSVREREDHENKIAALAAKIKSHPEEYLLISTGNYKVGVLGGISGFPVSITNRSGVSLDLVVVAVDYILHNKKIFKTENLSFHNLAPNATVSGEAPKSSRGVRITYRLTIANAQQIGMAYSNL